MTDQLPARVRFAPSPSGDLHVGNIRTALFDWAFARHTGGVFVLRIEDTDQSRVLPAYIESALETLRWLGLDWDEGPGVGGPYGPYLQSERREIYADWVAKFLESGHAYYCYCTPEELEDRRRAALKRGETPGYDGRCRNLSEAERKAFEAEGRPRAVRFAMPGTDIAVPDLIRGDTRFPASDLRDFVIMRSDGTPTYLLAAAVDDVAMKMTHVIRGEDLLPSTPRQLEIIHALGASPPAYAHLPLIVGPDHQPLSKRHGAVAVEWFKEQGLLPEALLNYLALLGWSYDETTTFMSREELAERFDLSRVSRNPAAFDRHKLEWMNGHYIREASNGRLGELLSETLFAEGLPADFDVVTAAVPLVRERMRTINEGAAMLRFLFVEDLKPDEKAQKVLGPDRAELLSEARSRLETIEDWTTEEIKGVLELMAEDLGMSKKQAFQPIRAAVTGAVVSPPLHESIALLGRARTLARLRSATGSQ